jgi:E3 ubiquitin-protein ligase RNF14
MASLRRLQELAGIGREKVELTEEEVRANDQRHQDEVTRFIALFPLVAIREFLQ